MTGALGKTTIDRQMLHAVSRQATPTRYISTSE